jgi:hypothetical protein
MEIESLRLTFFIVTNHQVGWLIRGRSVLLELALRPFLRFFGLFLLSRTLFLTFRKSSTRVSAHPILLVVLTDKVVPHGPKPFASGEVLYKNKQAALGRLR